MGWNITGIIPGFYLFLTDKHFLKSSLGALTLEIGRISARLKIAGKLSFKVLSWLCTIELILVIKCKVLTFRQQRNLILFFLIGERPHVCVDCGSSFMRTSTLNKHRKIHLKAKALIDATKVDWSKKWKIIFDMQSPNTPIKYPLGISKCWFIYLKNMIQLYVYVYSQ
jgi:hypothetical protein